MIAKKIKLIVKNDQITVIKRKTTISLKRIHKKMFCYLIIPPSGVSMSTAAARGRQHSVCRYRKLAQKGRDILPSQGQKFDFGQIKHIACLHQIAQHHLPLLFGVEHVDDGSVARFERTLRGDDQLLG